MKIILPALAMVIAAPAFAQTVAPPPAAPAAAEGEDNNQNKLICKSMRSTGSRLKSEKVCLTKAQWAQKQQDERQATERNQNQRQTF